jgi:hypothetical protein
MANHQNHSYHSARFTRGKVAFVVGLAFAYSAVRWHSPVFASIGVIFMIGGYALACQANGEWRGGWKEALRRFKLSRFTGDDAE